MSSSSGVSKNSFETWTTPPARGTGPLALPSIPGVAASTPPATASPIGPVLPQVGSYQEAALNPQGVQFAPPSPSQMMRSLQDARSLLRNFTANDSNQVAPIPAAWQPRLQALAKDLGFKDFASLQYQFRNLPAAHVNQWLSKIEAKLTSLPESQRTPQKLHELAKVTLLEEVDHATVEMFKAAGAAPPQFQAEAGRSWTPQAKLAVFNAFSEIRQTQPLETFRNASKNHKGGPLTFVRAEPLNPAVLAGKDGYLSAIEMLSGAMKVAYHNEALGSIVLHDGAIHANPRELLKEQHIQDFINLVNSPGDSPEKRRAISSVQELLNYSRSPQRQLNRTGQMDAPTKLALQAFDLQQRMTGARDTIEDDTQLSVPQKRKLLQRLTELQGRLDVGQSPLMLKAELGHILRGYLSVGEMQAPTRQRLDTQIASLDRSLSERFDQQTAEGLVGNWFGIIDSGKQKDFTEQVIVHELGHGLQEGTEVLENWRRISWDGKASEEENRNNVMGETMQGIGKQGFVSDYAQVNDEEDFAESYRMFTYQPERLLQASLLKFMFMAAATQSYAGKEEEMVGLIKKAGYKDDQIRNALLQLRGHLPSETRQYVKGVVDKTTTFSKILAPALGFAAEALCDKFKLKDKIADWWADFRGVDQKPQFTPRLAAALPEADALLNVDGTQYASSPREPGYVLDQLIRAQTVLNRPDSSPAARALASQKIEAFKQQGTGAWPASEQALFPPTVHQHLKGPSGQQNRAVVQALGLVLGKARARADWAALPEQAGNPAQHQHALKAFFEQVRRNPEILKKEFGEALYQQLPESFKAMLMEPDFVENITGKTGETTVNPSNIFDYTFAEIDRRESKGGLDFLTEQFKTITRFVSRERLDQAYQIYADRIQQFNEGTTQKAPLLDLEAFKAAVTRFREDSSEKQATAPVTPATVPVRNLDFEKSMVQDEAIPDEVRFMRELKIQVPHERDQLG
ncbi:MAG: putative zinc-binding metallopeptidase [Candidatus Sericytochromatia bacterium]